ncbi:hypothetical protein KUTeg_006592 [Tegillarca granosa]|uniref:Uncharacterized protein n=1 Tax=Tegillarca granosa TaxID=220873 RepID=A0ABQ9FF20_TEGGR|nr:hypothetical protein KUTeg_006592 [Tegillarca granosa]
MINQTKDMCIKFDKETKTFMLKNFKITNPSVGDYFFETFSISVIEKEENGTLEIASEDITSCPLKRSSNDRTLMKKVTRRKKKSLFRGIGNLFCCSAGRDITEVGDRYTKDDNDDVLKFFKLLKDVPENSLHLCEPIVKEKSCKLYS